MKHGWIYAAYGFGYGKHYIKPEKTNPVARVKSSDKTIMPLRGEGNQ